MRRSYRHLNEEDRDTLAILFNRGRSLRAIGKFLGRSASSLTREIRRNSTLTGYRPHQATRRATRRFQDSHRRPRLKDPALRAYVEAKLVAGWSPEIIAGRLAKDLGRKVLSPEAIYQWIYHAAPNLSMHLACARRRRKKRFAHRRSRVRIPDRIPLAQRPEPANQRTEPGHWETDLVVGSGRSALQVATERQTRLTRLCRIPDKTADSSFQGLQALLAPLPPAWRKSLTYDNGIENVLHQELNRHLGTQSYFCAPYHSWEKGTIENTNGLIRRFLPKRTNFDIIPISHFQAIEHWLNSRPRKCLNYQTSAEAFQALPVALAG